VVPVAAVAPSQSPRRARIAAAASPTAANATGITTYHRPMWAAPPAIRIAAPYGDWLLMYGAPTRLVSWDRCSQYISDARGATASPMSPQLTKVAAAMRADLVFPASRKNTMKMAGVSLIAAATPTPMPAVWPRDTRQTSVRMRASRIRLIWPRYSVWYTGSSTIAAAVTPAITSLDGWYPASLRVSTTE
jgi:hypothetical protein